jgi:aspartyl-tRNA(Asn)/glutamyl-tRNA(Gln) amidotransferase subunit A
MAYASSLDVVGCFGSSVLDSAILLGAVAGYDKNDSTSSPQVERMVHLEFGV